MKIKASSNQTFLTLVEIIAAKASGSGLSKKYLDSVSDETFELALFLKCNRIQSVLFSVICHLNINHQAVGIDQIATWLGCNSIAVAKHISEIEQLQIISVLRKDVIDKITSGADSISFSVNPDVFNALLKCKPLIRKNKKIKNSYDFIKAIAGIIKNRSEEDILFQQMYKEITRNNPKIIIPEKETIDKNLLHSNGITEKHLFYPSKEKEQIDFLTSMLMPTPYARLVKRLRSANMKTGVAILFEGSPGTGKTESVYQIAKQTGRDIFQVNISETKSKWFGESEKKIKEVFDTYRNISETMEVVPILLFNEADGIFSTRKNIGSSGVEQTENAIQNIILQEMEELKGILIATTNMIENFDNAFERRFLYKIRLNKPDVIARSALWLEKVPWMLKHEATFLAEKFDLSGGQIENVSRKALMYDVLHRKKAKQNQIEKWCIEENITQKRKIIGY